MKNNMEVKDFDYYLPQHLIAQHPLDDRSSSRLLVVDKKNGNLDDRHFYDIIDYLDSNDVLVLNNTKVMPSRIYGKKKDTLAHIELLLLKDLGNDIYEALARPFRRLNIGTEICFSDSFSCKVIEKLEDGIVHVKFSYVGVFIEELSKIGEMPLPPYIHEKLKDQNRYQTVYAKTLGSAAAPTAGLHFTAELLEKIRQKGVTILYVTLHVGLGTFRPMTVEKIEDHHMHSEWYHMSADVAKTLNDAKNEGKRIVAVGTTSVRTLESIMEKYGEFKEVSEETSIFIYPGFKFKAVDALITNFHLPKSTLVMLVSAFASKEYIMNAYQHAIKKEYRFFSFGDAMLIK